MKVNLKLLNPNSDQLWRGAAFAMLFAGLFLSGAGFANDELEIGDVWARESPPTVSNGAVYLVISDRNGAGDRLIGASTDIAAKAELHEHRMEHDNDSHKQSSQSGGSHGMMKMRQVEAIEIPANETVALAPMGYHIMLFDLKAPLKDGESFELTLEFEKTGSTVVAVDVRKPGS